MSTHPHAEHASHVDSKTTHKSTHVSSSSKKRLSSVATIAWIIIIVGAATRVWSFFGWSAPDMSFEQAYRTWTSSLTQGLSWYSTYINEFNKNTQNASFSMKWRSKDINGSLDIWIVSASSFVDMQTDNSISFTAWFEDKTSKQKFNASGNIQLVSFPDMLYLTIKDFGIDSPDAAMIEPMINTYRNKTISQNIVAESWTLTPMQLQSAFPHFMSSLSQAVSNNILFSGGAETSIDGRQAYPLTISQSGMVALMQSITSDKTVMNILSLDEQAAKSLQNIVSEISSVSFSGYLIVYGANEVVLRIDSIVLPDTIGTLSAILRLREWHITIQDPVAKTTFVISWEASIFGSIVVDIKTTNDGKQWDVNGTMNISLSSPTNQSISALDWKMTIMLSSTEMSTNPEPFTVSFDMSSTVKKSDTISIKRPTDVIPFEQLFWGMWWSPMIDEVESNTLSWNMDQNIVPVWSIE